MVGTRAWQTFSPYFSEKLAIMWGMTNGGRVVDTAWMAEGKCRDLPPETFFPSDGVGVEVARRICADCPVKAPCLEYALYNRIEHGVWGGASERERRRIARQRRGIQRTAL
jgi:WhiB family redox-sensing transcriptional regulator